MHKLFAHGEELHTADTSSLEHYLNEPLVSLPLYFGLLIGLYYVLKLGFKLPTPRILLIFMGIFLFSGVLLFSVAAAISVISLTAGVALALFFSLASIAK